MSGNYTTSKKTTYWNVRLVKDAKHFPASGEGDNRKPAATYLTIVDGTKGGEDIFVDCRAIRGSALLAGLKKGEVIQVQGTVEYKRDVKDPTRLRAKMWDADVYTLVNLKERAAETQQESSETFVPPPADGEGEGPAFD